MILNYSMQNSTSFERSSTMKMFLFCLSVLQITSSLMGATLEVPTHLSTDLLVNLIEPKLEKSGWKKLDLNENGQSLASLVSAGSRLKFRQNRLGKKLIEWDDDYEEPPALITSDYIDYNLQLVETNKSNLQFENNQTRTWPKEKLNPILANTNSPFKTNQVNKAQVIVDSNALNEQAWWINLNKNERDKKEQKDETSQSVNNLSQKDANYSIIDAKSITFGWRPLVSISRLQNDKDSKQMMKQTKSANNKMREATQKELSGTSGISFEGARWKPIVIEDRVGLEANSLAQREENSNMEIVYGKQDKQQFTYKLPGDINQPFDTETEDLSARRQSFARNQFNGNTSNLLSPSNEIIDWKKSKIQLTHGKDETISEISDPSSSSSGKISSAHWIPISKTVDILHETPTKKPVKNQTSVLASERGQASDLSYIYSASQPDWSATSTASAAAQAAMNSQRALQESGIIDTTSGSLPETVGSGTSMQSTDLQTMQPAPIQDQSTFASYGYATSPYSLYQQQSQQQQQQQQRLVDQQDLQQQTQAASGNYYQQLAARQLVPDRQQVLTQRQSAPQVVKHEHHYHYYNQDQSSNSQARQQQSSQTNQNVYYQQQQQRDFQQPATQLREVIQPLVISQPIIQHLLPLPTSTTSSTTPAPVQPATIIREIIREQPAGPSAIYQTIPLERLVAPAMPYPMPAMPATPPALPQTPQANFESSARQMIRQISQQIPTMRVANVANIRLPLRNSASSTSSSSYGQTALTRQTASYITPPVPKKTTTYLTQSQLVPTHTTIMHTTQFTPATRTTVFTTEHVQTPRTLQASSAYRRK